MSKIILFENGRPYLAKSISTKEAAGICYKCAAYKACSELGELILCSNIVGACYFVKVPTDQKRLEELHVDEFDFSQKKVRHGGKVLNKYDMAQLIHEAEALLGRTAWPLATDVYYDEYHYDYMKETLREDVLVLLTFINYSKL